MQTDRHELDPRLRSLLQKAVRRGCVNLVFTTCAMVEEKGAKAKNWLRKRAAVITFEECWPLGAALAFTKDFSSKAAALAAVARSEKTKDAAGLGSLAFALAGGDRSVLTGAKEDRDIKIVADALKRPEDFWGWIDGQRETAEKKSLLKNAARWRNIGLPQEQAFSKAAAYLTLTREIPVLEKSEQPTSAFPWWVALDGHTRQGRRALSDTARDLHIPAPLLEWCFFFYEGSRTQRSASSPWWDRVCRWRFRKAGLPPEEAHLLWEPAKIQLAEALEEDGRRLHKEVYRWKMANRQQVETLKNQVERHQEAGGRIHPQQSTLFG